MNNYVYLDEYVEFIRSIVKFVKQSCNNNNLNLKNDVITKINSTCFVLNSFNTSKIKQVMSLLTEIGNLRMAQGLHKQ